jgi:mRNA interferase RelE/StbE
MYKVIWESSSEKGLTKIDKKLARKIKNKVETYLAQDPINRGEPLDYDYKGYYRYRFSDYRVIYQVKETELLVIVVKVGHRKEIY